MLGKKKESVVRGTRGVGLTTREEQSSAKLSRKELLLQYRQTKDKDVNKDGNNKDLNKDVNKENTGIPKQKGDNQVDLKMKMKKATIATIAPTKPVKKSANKEKIEMAGREKIAPSTPIGKLKRRLQKSQQELEHQSPQRLQFKVPNRTLEDLHQKLIEAQFLSQSHGAKIARTFLENLKSQEGFGWIVTKAIYWLACIKLEIRDRKWEKVEQLFSLADGALEDASDRSALATAYDDFKESTSAALKDKLKGIQSSTAVSVPAPVPVAAVSSESTRQSRDPAPPTNPFQNVNVSLIRSIFEKNLEQDSTTPPLVSTTISPHNSHPTAENKPIKKKLVGGIPLLGLAAACPSSSRSKSPQQANQSKSSVNERNLELLLLGIGPFEDTDTATDTATARADNSSPVSLKRKKCATRRPVSVSLEFDSNEEEDQEERGQEEEEEEVREIHLTSKRSRVGGGGVLVKKNETQGPQEKESEKKLLRFESSLSTMEGAGIQKGRINRKGTPYKHSRRGLDIEED